MSNCGSVSLLSKSMIGCAVLVLLAACGGGESSEQYSDFAATEASLENHAEHAFPPAEVADALTGLHAAAMAAEAATDEPEHDPAEAWRSIAAQRPASARVDQVPGAASSTVALAPEATDAAVQATPDLSPLAAPAPAAARSLDAAPLLLSGTGVMRTSSACTSSEYADFVDTPDWAYRRLLPTDCMIVRDNPVVFSWTQPKDRDLSQPWTLTITNAGGAVVRRESSPSPRLMLASPLDIGSYRWQVSYRSTAGAERSSAWRRFEIDATTATHTVPTAAGLASTVTARAAPRLLPRGFSWPQVAAMAQAGDYKDAYAALLRTAERSLTVELTPSPDSKNKDSFAKYSDYAGWLLKTGQLTRDELQHVEALSFAWRLTGRSEFLAAAKRRLLNLASWDPDGGTSEADQPISNRGVYMALAVGLDLIGSALSSAERASMAAACEARLAAAVATLERLDTTPYSTFENSTVKFSLQALLLVAGTQGFPNSQAMLKKVWPYFLTAFSAQSGEDGGLAGSVAYAWYELDVTSRTLATLLTVADVDATQWDPARNLGDYFLAMTTPVTPQFNSFGDGLETSNLYLNYAFAAFRLYAAIARNPNYEWYWRQDTQNKNRFSYLTPLHFLVQARNGALAKAAAPQQTDWVFGDAGVASFSIGVDAKRSSLQFISSRFGSYTHSHADQNSFTLSSRGTNLLINSGYYPYYGSPHHSAVTRSTRYKNAVTFDGGIGQAEAVASPTAPTNPMTSMGARGRLINAHSDASLSVATGDATLAYRGWDARAYRWTPLLSNAVRSIAYLKNERVVVVYDWLTSDTARQWEWNYHGLAPFGIIGSVLKAKNGDASACITHHGVAGSLSTRTGFSVAPENGLPDQYHALYRATRKTTNTVAVTVIREDCSAVPVTVGLSGTTADVKVGAASLSFDKRSVTVPRSAAE